MTRLESGPAIVDGLEEARRNGVAEIEPSRQQEEALPLK
jgi:hypothetical protein